jgi:peptide/nickel transport system substrate-binding protein
MDFEQELIDIVLEYRTTYDVEGRRELMFRYNQIYTENVYEMGVFIGRYGLGLSKRVQNVPDGTPVFLYQWVEDAILLDTMWTPVDQQLEQIRPDTIPVYAD